MVAKVGKGMQTTHGAAEIEAPPVPEREGPDPELLKEKAKIHKRQIAALKSLRTALKKDQELSKLHPKLGYMAGGGTIPYDLNVYMQQYMHRAIRVLQAGGGFSIETMNFPY